MYHSPITVCETHPNYPTVSADDRYRVIVCVDSIQYILQKRKGTQWHNRSYLTEWETLCRHNPQLHTFYYVNRFSNAGCYVK